MEKASEASAALKMALTLERHHLEREMKEIEDEIRTTLSKWTKRSKELEELEKLIKFQEAMRTAKLASNGRRAAAELLKYGVSHHVSLLDRC